MSDDSTVIETNGLSKRYAGVGAFALKDLTFTVKRGEVYGFLGPNGAGKSTTIRLLLNFIQPTEGTAAILGKDIIDDSTEIKRSIGYLAGDAALYARMTGRDFYEYMAELQPPKNQGYLKELAKRFQANLDMKIRDLSKGNRQKIALIQAFMHEPEILILDEPTSGLDPLMQEEFFKLVGETKKRGATLFISSHNLAEVQKMCDRVGFIREGRLISEQDIKKALADAARTFDITFYEAAPITELKKVKGAKVTSDSKRKATVHMHGDLAPMFRVLASHRVVSINQREVSLEAEFLKFYEGGKQ